MRAINNSLVVCLLAMAACDPPPFADEPANAVVEDHGSGTSNWWDSLPRPEWGVPFEKVAGLAGEIDIAVTSHNVPIVDGSYILALGLAFEQIKAGSVEYQVTDGNREYQFDGFSVIVKGD